MKTFSLILTLWAVASAAMAIDPMVLKNDSNTTWGWTAFGHGLNDSGIDESDGTLWVALNWAESTWGDGIYYKDKGGAPIDVTPYKKISVKVSTEAPSKTVIRIELLSSDNAVLGTDPEKPYTLKATGETLIEADISKMIPVQAEKDQRAFIPAQDLKKVDRIQITFLKPEDKETKNTLKFKEMKLLP